MIKKKKTPAQECFEGVRMYEVGADWDAVRRVFARKNAIEDELVKDILATVKNIEDFGLLVRKEVFLGLVPEEPSPEVQQATQNIQFTFLRELEHEGAIKDLKEITKEEFDGENQWLEKYAVMSFYPNELRNYLKNELPLKRGAEGKVGIY